MIPDKPPARILVVEDSATQAQQLQITLEAEGFEVEVAADGQAGLEAFRARPFDAVLSDISMPNLSGYDLCRAIKAGPARKYTPFVLLTALKEPQDVILGLECGADNFIRKPYEPEDLVSRLNAVIAAQGMRSPPRPDGGAQVRFMGGTYTIAAGKEQILGFLASTFEDFVHASGREQKVRLAVAKQQATEEAGRAAKEVLRASEERFRAFMDNNHSVASMKDEGGRLVYVNAPFLQCFGGESANWLGKTGFELWPEDVATALRENDLAVLRGGKSVELLETMPTAAGETRQWSTFKFPFRDSQGRKLLGAIAMDVTDKLRAELEIRTLNVRLERRLKRLKALRRIDQTITASLDLRVTLDTVLDQVTTQLEVDATAVLLLDPHTHVLEYAAGRGFRGTGITRSRLHAGEGVAGRIVLDGRLVSLQDLGSEADKFIRSSLLEGESFVGYYGAPLVAKGKVIGVLEIFQRGPLGPDQEWVDFLEALAGQTAIAVENAALFDDLRRANAELTLAYDATIEGWARALDLRDKETEGHTRRVTEMAVRLAKVMGMGGAELSHIWRGAMLHDVGKLGIPDSILLKPGKLDEEEWKVMRRHPEYAHEWLAPIAFLRPALDIPCGHHERWDGAGYPRGLKGEQIPFAARLFAAIDIWDALRSDRPYRKGWPEEKVREHLRSLAGNHLDPEVVRVFLLLLDADAELAGTGDATAGPTALTPSGREGPALADAERRVLEGLLRAQMEEVKRMRGQLEEQSRGLAMYQARMAELTAADPLTGLMGQRQFREALESAFSYAVRNGQPLSVALLDVDHFQSYNDDNGHQAGDSVLCALARVIGENVRPYDRAARQGGDQFPILLPASDAGEGLVVAERLRSAIAGQGWAHRPVTVSVGVATLTPAVLNSVELVEQAARALIHSKELGRDCVTHFDDVASPDRGRHARPAVAARA